TSVAEALAAPASKLAASVTLKPSFLNAFKAVEATSAASPNSNSPAAAKFNAQNGLKGSDAGTSLKTMLMRLNPSTKEAYNKKSNPACAL
ncbi:hypothetical protein ACUODJ_51125, partial [Escherichia sp. HC-CC]